MKPFLNMVAGFFIEQSWQISIVVGLVLVACWILRNASAHWRYLLWLVVIGKCLMPPIFTVQLPLLPAEEGMLPQTIVTESPSSISDAGFDSSGEIAKAPSHITQQTESVAMEFAAASSASREPISLPLISLNMREWLVSAWLMIAGILIIQVNGRMWSTHRRLQRTCEPADDETQAAVATLAETLGIKTPAVHMADSIAQPFVWGWLRGDVYLPKQFAETGTVEQRRAILMHELAHVLRWDAALNHLQNFVQALYFFHPLIWWTNQKIRQEREKCCDEIVLSATDTQPRVYCEAIVEMLAREYTSRQSTPALAVTGSLRNIKERITTMLTPNRTFLRRPSRVAVVTILFIAACVLPSALVMTPQTSNAVAQDAAAQDDAAKPEAVQNVADNSGNSDTKPARLSTWPAGQTMDFRIINADTKEPISDVTLELQNMGPGIDFGDVKIQKTDADGWSRIPLPDLPPTAVRVYPVKEGFVPLRVIWEAEPHPTMPKTITIPMEPAKTFGGVVQNEAGEPIPDVTVTIWFWADGKGANPHIRENIEASTKTDKNGRWSIPTMPAIIDNTTGLHIYVHHPDYVSDHLRRAWHPIPVTEQPPVDQLFDQSAVMVMREGETVEGTVVDQDGKPIPNAVLYDNEYYWFDPDKKRATTDTNGEFRISGVHFDPNQIDFSGRFDPALNQNRFAAQDDDTRRGIILTVEAAGYAPGLVFVHPSSSPLEVQLEKGESVHGQVVDENDKPIEGVTINVNRWREQGQRLHRETKTDADGRFELKDLPTDEVKYGIGKDGYMYVSDFPMEPSSDAYTVTLKPPVQIVGAVTDEETGKPIEKFTLIPGSDYEDGRNPSWNRWQSRTIVDEGRYETTFRQEEFSWLIRIEAEGYMPAESRIFRLYNPDKGKISYDFKLTRAAPLTGIVLGLDDLPLANANVYLSTDALYITNRKVGNTDVRPVKTDAAGRFELPPEVEEFCIVVVHEDGIGMITEAECVTPPHITIKPWTDHKDHLQIFRKPAAGVHSDFP